MEWIRTYLKSGLNSNTARLRFPTNPSKSCQYVSAEILHGDGELGSDFSCDEPVTIRLRFEIRESTPSLFLAFYLQNLDGTRSLSPMSAIPNPIVDRMDLGLHTFEIQIPPPAAGPTTYLLSVNSVVRFSGVSRSARCMLRILTP